MPTDVTLRRHRKRLLHPGVHTEQILEVYVATIRVLRLIDPPGVLLHQVAEPIRRYLRARPDTIRVIVAALVGDTRELGDRESILHQLLADENGTPQPLQTVKAEDYDDPHWVPEPKDAPSGECSFSSCIHSECTLSEE
jgi:anaphase-promoting complex subunit 2